MANKIQGNAQDFISTHPHAENLADRNNVDNVDNVDNEHNNADNSSLWYFHLVAFCAKWICLGVRPIIKKSCAGLKIRIRIMQLEILPQFSFLFHCILLLDLASGLLSLYFFSPFFPSLVHTLGSSLVFSPFSHRSSFTSFTQLCLNILMLVDLLDV